MSRVLLTGASGFLGSHIASKLLELGVDCTAIVRDGRRYPVGCRAIVADLNDLEALKSAARNHANFDAVMHIAASMPNSAISGYHESGLHRNQVQIAENVVASFASARHIVFSSSVDVYGIPIFLPVSEGHPLNPLTDYAKAKVDVENFLRNYCENSRKILTIFRTTHLYGPGEPCIKGIPLFISAILRGETPTIFGDGSDKRDFLHVDDAADAFAVALMQPQEGIFILGSGRSMTMRDVLSEIIKLSGKEIIPRINERIRPKVDLELNVNSIQRTFGWEARTEFLEGLRCEYDWYQKTASHDIC